MLLKCDEPLVGSEGLSYCVTLLLNCCVTLGWSLDFSGLVTLLVHLTT